MITGDTGKHAVYYGMFVDVVEESLDRTQKLLNGFKGGWEQAVGSAIKRAAAAGKTVSKKAITDEYTISQSTYLHETRNISHFKREGAGWAVEFGYAGYVIPLLKFNTKIGRDGKIYTQVKKSSAGATLDRAFTAQMGSHFGVYERIGEERLPVEEKFGPSTPQMMYSNENVLDTIETRQVEVYQQRLDHEILRVMNGW